MILVDRIDLAAGTATLEVWDEDWSGAEARVRALAAPARVLGLQVLQLRSGVVPGEVAIQPARQRRAGAWPLLEHRAAWVGAGVRYTARLAHRADAHRGIAAYVELLLRAADTPAQDLVLVRLMTYELCVNAIEHGLPLSEHPTLEIGFEIGPASIHGWLRDACAPFDPTAFQSTTVDRLVAEGRRRGWGLRMVRRVATALEHTHDGHGNHVSFTKELTHETTT